MTVMNDAWMTTKGLPLAAPEEGRDAGYVLGGLAIGALIGLIGVALVAIFNRGLSRGDMLFGSWIGAAAGFVAVFALTLSTS